MTEVVVVSDGSPRLLQLVQSAPVIVGAPEPVERVVIQQPAPVIVGSQPAAPSIVQPLIGQGPRGLSAFEEWQQRNPGGTWAEFLASLGTGAVDVVVHFSYGDASPYLVFTLPEDGMISEIQLTIREEFDGTGAALAVRTSSMIYLMEDTQNAPSISATYETTPVAELPAGTGILLEITPGAGATKGTGVLQFNLH